MDNISVKRRNFILTTICFLLSAAYGMNTVWGIVRIHVNSEAALARMDEVFYIYNAARASHWHDIWHWWLGPWIYPGVGYYRPLTSMLYFFECRLFGDNFTDYNYVSWVMHGFNCGLLYLFAESLFSNHNRFKRVYALAAVYFFAFNGNSMFFAICRAMTWFPAQNDVLCLTFGLLFLVLLDRALLSCSKPLLLSAYASFICSVFSKEMGYILVPIAWLLIYYRSGWRWKQMGWLFFVALCLWWLRKLLVPVQWDPQMLRWVIFRKACLAWLGPLWYLGASGTWWPIAASVLTLAIAYVGVRMRWKTSILVLVCVLVIGLCAQFVGSNGTWALLFVSGSLEQFMWVMLFLVGILFFWKYRNSEKGLFAGVTLDLVYFPILQYGGPHYYYWPAAFLGLMNAAFCVCAVRWLKERCAAYRESFTSGKVI